MSLTQFRRLCLSIHDTAEIWRKRHDFEHSFVITTVRRTPGRSFIVEQFEYGAQWPEVGPSCVFRSECYTRQQVAFGIAKQRHDLLLQGFVW